MAGLIAIREALAKNLEAIPNVQTSAWILANPTPPTLYVLPDEVQYDKVFGRGHDDNLLRVQALVGVPGDISAQRKLDEFLEPAGASSVKAAVEADPRLGGLVDDLRVTSCESYRIYAQPDQRQYLGAQWRVFVMAPTN